MQVIQWTNELLALFALTNVVMLVLGTALGVKSKVKTLSSLQDELRKKQIAESTFNEQLRNFTNNETRLNTDLAQSKHELQTVSSKLEEAMNQKFVAEKQLEGQLVEIRSLKDHMNELRERLTLAETTVEAERKTIKSLNERLMDEGKVIKSYEVSEKERREQISELKEQLAVKEASYLSLQDRYQLLSNEYTELKTTLLKKEEHFKEQVAHLQDAKISLTKEFENIANKIFDEKGKTFTTTSQTSIDILLKPFREQIEGFQKRINEVHDASIQGNTTLTAEIQKILEVGLHMSKEANNLTSALKGDSQQRGAWGEAQLKRTLEMSGLVEEAHYEVQTAFKDADGKQKQTDYLIKLPDGKHIIIDSKVSLVAYDRAVSAETSEEYNLAMAEHVKAVRRHIDDLSSKDYTNLIGMRSPNFVLMFMPIEPAYIEALKTNKDLFEYGYKKGIVLVSHTTLIPILRTVSNLWMIERSNAEAREISERAGDIYNQVCTVAERLSKLGNTLSTVSNHYNSIVTAIAGQQGLYGKVDRFSQLSAKVSKNLPQLEPAHMDFEVERLSLIVEPLPIESLEEHANTDQASSIPV